MFRDVSLQRLQGAVSADLVEKMVDVLQQPAEEDTSGLSPAVLRWLDGRSPGEAESSAGHESGQTMGRESRE